MVGRIGKECAQILFILIGIWKEAEIIYRFSHRKVNQTEAETLTKEAGISSQVLG